MECPELTPADHFTTSFSFCLYIFDGCKIDMINIFEVFLPQLLRYPNPTDPLNGEAAAMLMREAASYEQKVKGNY